MFPPSKIRRQRRCSSVNQFQSVHFCCCALTASCLKFVVVSTLFHCCRVIDVLESKMYPWFYEGSQSNSSHLRLALQFLLLTGDECIYVQRNCSASVSAYELWFHFYVLEVCLILCTKRINEVKNMTQTQISCIFPPVFFFLPHFLCCSYF